MPDSFRRFPDRQPCYGHAFRPQQAALEPDVSAEATQSASCTNHSMAGYVWPPASAHDVADSARGPRPSSQARDIPVRGDTAGRDAPDDSEHAPGEIRGFLAHNAPCGPQSTLVCHRLQERLTFVRAPRHLGHAGGPGPPVSGAQSRIPAEKQRSLETERHARSRGDLFAQRHGRSSTPQTTGERTLVSASALLVYSRTAWRRGRARELPESA
jgi:hypothetical protein